jgi:YidC/Oxa1 family membrane protein insertase
MQQRRLLLALVLSSAVLILWTYLYPAPSPPPDQQQSATPSPSPAATQQAAQPATPSAPAPSVSIAQAPQRTITIQTDYYTAKFDTRGAEPTSWIITRNKYSNTEIFSVAGKKSDRIPLELVSAEGLKRQPRVVPLQLQTGDAALDEVLATSTYRVEGEVPPEGDAVLKLSRGEKKELTFVLEDANGLQVRKTIVFDADRYATDLSLQVKRGDAVVPQVKVAIGPSIGDQGISHHTFYSVAPEAVAYVGDKLERHLAHSINENSSSPDRLVLNGTVDWAGVADTYFGMVAIPSKKVEGLEYRTISYEHKPNGGSAEKRYLITAYVPAPSDGSRTVIYAGPKDHYLLTDASRDIGQAVQRPIDLDGLIDYGFLGWISRPLAVPILQAITYLYKLTSSYGIAIILFTIVIYSLFFPLKWRSSKAMKKAQKLAPKMKELQE